MNVKFNHKARSTLIEIAENRGMALPALCAEILEKTATNINNNFDLDTGKYDDSRTENK
jgi:predicted DNA-binding ribbon-helix-helix protein